MPRSGQRGLALILMTAILVLGTTYVLVKQMDSLSMRLGQDRVTYDALMQAKTALIGYAAKQLMTPGALPCPDLNNDGKAEGNCANPNQRVGYLPWQTLGLSDLRDASGERLWYALSTTFRNASGVIINSDTQGQLTITGNTPASNVVAIVFAPGAPLSGQIRDSTQSIITPTPPYLNVANFLEGKNNFLNDPGATNDDQFEFLSASGSFNDRLMTISQADLFNVVENMVARRIETQVKPYIQDLYKRWQTVLSPSPGFYPFAALFDDPGYTPQNPGRPQQYYTGTIGQTYGLLPITSDPGWVTWLTGATSIVQNGGSGWIFWTDCSRSSATQIVCDVYYFGGQPILQMQLTLQHVLQAFVRPLQANDFSLTGFSGSSTTLTGNNCVLNPTPIPSPVPNYCPAVINPDQTASFAYSGQLRSVSSTGGGVTITVSVPGSNGLTSSGDPYVGWFVTNQWFKQTLYAVSPGMISGGGGTCTPGGTLSDVPPACLTVNNLGGTNNDKWSLLVFAGRSISTGARPSSLFPDYLEGQNATTTTVVSATTGTVFETRLRSTTFNDRVITVCGTSDNAPTPCPTTPLY